MERDVVVRDLGSRGIRLDVQPEKAGEGVVQDMVGLDPFVSAGLLERESGLAVEHVMQMVTGSTGSVAAQNVLWTMLDGNELLCGTGRMRAGGTTKTGFWWCTRPGTDPETWESWYLTSTHPGKLGQPVDCAGEVVAPLGPFALPMLASWNDFHSDFCFRTGKLGYPELSCDEGDSVYVPFLYVESHNNDGQAYPFGYNSGAVGYAEGGAVENMEVVNYDAASRTFQYAYSMIWQIDEDGDRGYGWGYEGGTGNGWKRWILKEFALGYVYVYTDGTMSEPVVYRWHNSSGGGFLFSPFSMRWSNEANICIVAYKGRVQLPKHIVDREKSIVGVRVFYTHNSSLREDDEIDSGYRGWSQEVDILSNMREAFYLDEADRSCGYCALSRATEASHDPFGTTSAIDVYRFGAFLCPAENSVSQDVEYDRREAPYFVSEPMALGAKWPEVRGDIAEGNGLVVQLPSLDSGYTLSPMRATLYERGVAVSSWAASEADGAGDMDFEAGIAGAVRGRADVNAAGVGVVCQAGGFLVAGRIRRPGDEKVALDVVCVSHVGPDGTVHPATFPRSREIRVQRGEVVAVCGVGQEALIGTSETVYVLSFGDGTPESWSVRDLNVPGGVAGPRAMVAVGYSAWIATCLGRVVRYDMGAIEARDMTAPLVGSGSPLVEVPRALVRSGLRSVSVFHDPERDRVYACAATGTTGAWSLMVDPQSGGVVRSAKSFVCGGTNPDGVAWLSTGNTVLSLSADSDTIWTAATSFSGAMFRRSGIVNAANDEIAFMSVTDADLDQSTTGWGTTYDTPMDAEVSVGVAYIDTDDSSDDPLGTRSNARPCFEVAAPQAITGYADDDPVAGYGKVDTVVALFSDTAGGAKTGCGGYPNAWATYGKNDGEDTVDASSAIGFSWTKEVGLGDQWRYVAVDAVHVAAEIEDGSDQTVSVALSDPSGFWGGKSFSFAAGSALHSRGRAAVFTRGLLSRLKIVLSGALGAGKSLSIRYLSVRVRNGGRDAS